jgi:hypothetical protein
MLNNFTEKNLRRQLAWDNGNAASVHAKIFRPLSHQSAPPPVFASLATVKNVQQPGRMIGCKSIRARECANPQQNPR